MKRVAVVHTVVVLENLPVFKKFESFRKLQRVIAYVLRFWKNAAKKKQADRVLQRFPTMAEMNDSLKVIVRVIQYQEFGEEIARLQSDEPCKKLCGLHPVLDEGLLRVGGRLRFSKLPFPSKHQWILPNRHPVVDSLITALHRENLHIGPSALLATLRRQFWVPRDVLQFARLRLDVFSVSRLSRGP